MSNVFCDEEVHVGACCAAAADFLPARHDGFLNEMGELIRQPSGEEVGELLRAAIEGMEERGELAETTAHKLTRLVNDYVIAVDDCWWNDMAAVADW